MFAPTDLQKCPRFHLFSSVPILTSVPADVPSGSILVLMSAFNAKVSSSGPVVPNVISPLASPVPFTYTLAPTFKLLKIDAPPLITTAPESGWNGVVISEVELTDNPVPKSFCANMAPSAVIWPTLISV